MLSFPPPVSKKRQEERALKRKGKESQDLPDIVLLSNRFPQIPKPKPVQWELRYYPQCGLTSLVDLISQWDLH